MSTPPSAPGLPWSGLLAVLASYSSKGQLYSALAGATDEVESEWTPRDVRRRARRILLDLVAPAVVALPASGAAWIDALPAQTRRHRATSETPAGRVDWVRTRMLGWPPERFVATQRTRHADDILLNTLAWTAQRLLAVASDANAVLQGASGGLERQLGALRDAERRRPLADAVAVPPGRPELSALRATGRPWAGLARVAELLQLEDTDLATLARHLVLPDADLQWRLFHLGCLGVVLTTLTELGWTTRSRRPIGIGAGPTYQLVDPHDRPWDLWFEAAGAWKYYKVPSPYLEATRGLPGASQPLGADIALVRPGAAAVTIECKYSDDPTYIARSGYLQAVTYLAELRTIVSESATAIVLGPDGIVGSTTTTELTVGRVYFTPPSKLPEVLAANLS